ncbi:MAG: hypothetical protein QM784_19450 [Polyangiaceae bacterium]
MLQRVYLCLPVLLLLVSAPAFAQRSALGSLPEVLEAGESPTETFELNHLALVRQRYTKLTFLGFSIVSEETWWPVRGKYRYGLSRQDFFERAGQPNLAERQSLRDTWSDVLFYGGFVVSLGAIAYPFVFQGEDGVEEGDILVGLGIFLTGVVATNIGSLMSGPVIDREEAERLAQRYNLALSRRLALGPSAYQRAPFHASTPWASYTLRF